MTESLFLLGSDNIPKKMDSTEFATEDVFQDLLARFPDLLTDADFGEGTSRRWMLLTREAPVPDSEDSSGRWALDHLFVDQDGVPTLVEVKRATDTRARREVVAQMLDYAANAVSWWKVEDLERLFSKSCQINGTSEKSQLGKLLRSPEPDAEAFWRSVQSNLSSGRIRMIFVADRIGPELARIVQFLNEQMKSATVVALELRQFSDGADRILAPRLIGLTPRAADQKRIARPNPAGSVEEWFATATETDSIKRFIDDMLSLGASCAVAGQSLAIDYGPAPLRVAYIRSNGRVALATWQLTKTEAFKVEARRMDLLAALEASGFGLSSRNTSGEPTFSLPRLDDTQQWALLKHFFENLFQEFK
jgi:hypothetical protein